tara:strand:+ start:152 stop:778 length:627 start_codon:yes stop_codon:yes gene_type:complete
MVQSKEERKAKKKEYNARPENKKKQKEWYDKNKKQVAEKRKKRDQTSHGKLLVKKHRNNPKTKAKKVIYQKQYNIDNAVRIKENSIKYEANPVNRKMRKDYRDKIKFDVFSYFSKLHSDSDIPCCRCCGENSHLDFLNLDHIQGREKMNSFKELKEIGYDSDVRDKSLQIWIKKNNYLSDLKKDYFQILCYNCNMTKGHFGSCPHTRK